ncbi:MAG: hypothetical protein QM496_21965 [Verrucomicrobiota bacterium]
MKIFSFASIFKNSQWLLLTSALILSSCQDQQAPEADQTAAGEPLPPLITTAGKTDNIYRKRFDLPRAVFTHGNMVKPGVVFALKGQDNFLPLYVAAIEDDQKKYQAEGFSYTILVPNFIQILDPEKNGLTISKTTFEGKSYKKIERQLDPKKISARCFKAAYGLEETLWYRFDENHTATEPPLLRITLNYQGKPISRAEARLHIYDELEKPAQVSPDDFKFYLASGPLFRPGHYDEFAKMQRKAGFNTLLLFSKDPEPIKEMKKRGFYVIAQRGGSYHKVQQQLKQCLEQGPAWFTKADGGEMEKVLAHSDAVLWDFEPRPQSFSSLPADEWSIAEFRKTAKIKDDIELTEKIIKEKYHQKWIEFRQDQLALVIKHWVDFCHAINPKIETIITEGRSNRFDPSEQIDYKKYARYVTYCDPMNTNMRVSVTGMKKWMARVPEAEFLGCQNLAMPGSHISYGQDISKLQLISSVLIGSKGNAIFPGRSMDASDFVIYNRAMNFIGKHQNFFFKGQADPKNISLAASSDKDIVSRAYADNKGDNFLLVACNWNRKNDATLHLKMNPGDGEWLLIDEDNRQRFTLDGKTSMPASALQKGVSLNVPAASYRGFRLLPHSKEALKKSSDFIEVKVKTATSGDFSKTKQSSPSKKKTPVAKKTQSTLTTSADDRLLFHLDFKNQLTPAISVAKTTQTVKGSATFQKSPMGQALKISDGLDLEYLAEGNIDLNRGRLETHFNPLWQGGDKKSHVILRAKPNSGLLYFGKSADGRLLFNLVDAKGAQHHMGIKVRDMPPGEWHVVTILWDASQGKMSMDLDGKESAVYEGEPWTMQTMNNKNPKSKIHLPADAEIILDELKIWTLK